MKNKPDDRRDNVEKLQANITHTIQNIELAEETMAETSNQQMNKTFPPKTTDAETHSPTCVRKSG
jgi:small acid-soluble spore protein (thioredoxin-like protein)